MRWTDGDFNRNNLKSQFGTRPISARAARFPTLTRYSRATLYGGFLFASFMQALHYAHGALPDLVKVRHCLDT